MRQLAAALLLLSVWPVVAAAQSRVASSAVVPDRTALDRVNLKTDWTAYLPVEGKKDGIDQADLLGEQVFVQTRAGWLLSIDANTGREMWKFKFDTSYTAGFPVAANDKYVIALNVATLYCFQRFTGLLAFEYELPDAPAAGPAMDGEYVFVPYTGSRVVCLRMPEGLKVSGGGQAGSKAGDLTATNKVAAKDKSVNPADLVAQRFGSRNYGVTSMDTELERPVVSKAYLDPPAESNPGNRSPSMSSLSSMVPPYNLRGLHKSESLTILNTLRKPYTMRPEHLTYNQQSPSIVAIPPSVARVHELSNLRPPGIAPTHVWTLGTSTRLKTAPVLVDPTGQNSAPRVWVFEDGRSFQAVTRLNKSPQVSGTLDAAPAGPIAGPVEYTATERLGFVPLVDGQVVAIDMTGGNVGAAKVEWRANVGGLLDRQPLPAPDGIYVAGRDSGAARINPVTGTVDWRTESLNADRVLAVNDERVYVYEQSGHLHVYAKGRVNDAVTRRAKPLGSVDLTGFRTTLINTKTDRILVAGDNGLLVCLRDSATKYTRAKSVVPVVNKPAEPKKEEPKVEEPKKEEPKKEEKKDEPKKDEPKKEEKKES